MLSHWWKLESKWRLSSHELFDVEVQMQTKFSMVQGVSARKLLQASGRYCSIFSLLCYPPVKRNKKLWLLSTARIEYKYSTIPNEVWRVIYKLCSMIRWINKNVLMMHLLTQRVFFWNKSSHRVALDLQPCGILFFLILNIHVFHPLLSIYHTWQAVFINII